MSLSVSLQYWYEGDEAGDLPVDFSIVWDGDFFIDKPASMKGRNCSSSTTQTFNCIVHLAAFSSSASLIKKHFYIRKCERVKYRILTRKPKFDYCLKSKVGCSLIQVTKLRCL